MQSNKSTTTISSKLLTYLALIFLCPLVSLAYSNTKEQKYYVKVDLGLPVYRNIIGGVGGTTKFNVTGHVAAGVDYKKIALELEAGYLHFRIKTRMTNIANVSGNYFTSTMTSKTLFLNLFFRPELQYQDINPYIGVGIGGAFNAMGNRYSSAIPGKFIHQIV